MYSSGFIFNDVTEESNRCNVCFHSLKINYYDTVCSHLELKAKYISQTLLRIEVSVLI